MLLGSPTVSKMYRSRQTTKAVNSAWKSTGTMIAPWMAPLIKRKTKGHLKKVFDQIRSSTTSTGRTFAASVGGKGDAGVCHAGQRCFAGSARGWTGRSSLIAFSYSRSSVGRINNACSSVEVSEGRKLSREAVHQNKRKGQVVSTKGLVRGMTIPQANHKRRSYTLTVIVGATNHSLGIV